MFFNESPDVVKVADHNIPWLFASGYQHEKPLTFQLQEKDQPEASYTVSLYFAENEDLSAGQRVFDVELQGKPALRQFDIVAETGGPRRATVRVIRNVAVNQALTIALKPADESKKPPSLSAVAIEREPR